MRKSFYAAGVLILAGFSPVFADTLEKTNGQKLDGRVLAETADNVTFEVNSGGISFTQRIPRGQIRKLEREVKEGPGYCGIPLIGEIGVEVTAMALKSSLMEARKYKPDYIILVINSNGGLVTERDRIVAVLRENQDLKIIAYVQKAMSAAAIIALACPDLYFAPDGQIGAAVSYRQTPNGTPQIIEEKYLSAIRAAERSASELGRRSELWSRGMSDGDVELSVMLDSEHGREILEGHPNGSKLIKRKGQILTMTGREAVEWGMASGMAASVEGLKEPLKLKAWHNEDKRPWQMMADSGRIARQHLKEKQEDEMRRAQRASVIRQIGPEMNDLQARMEKARARVLAEEQALTGLKGQYEAELAAIEDTFDRAMASEGTKAGQTIALKTKLRALTNLRNKYEPQIASHEQKHIEALQEAAQLSERLKANVANLPAE